MAKKTKQEEPTHDVGMIFWQYASGAIALLNEMTDIEKSLNPVEVKHVERLLKLKRESILKFFKAEPDYILKISVDPNGKFELLKERA